MGGGADGGSSKKKKGGGIQQANGSNGSSNGVLSDSEVTRVAMRLTMSAFSKLELKSETLSDAELLEQYILMCPYLSHDHPAVLAALQGLHDNVADNFTTTSNNNNMSNNNRSREIQFVQEQDDDEPDIKASVKTMTTKKKKMSYFSLFGYLVRTLVLDLPVAILFALYLTALFARHLETDYWTPTLSRLAFPDQRGFTEMTYYSRRCDASDMSTQTPSDLFLPLNASVQDAYQHQLKHGFTVFPQILSDETSTQLRDYVMSRNFNLTKEESIFVIENTNRYSFGLGTEEPSVTRAMSELASHPRLVPALEHILGENPALIEMTAITSCYGAVHQYWHDDVIARASAIQFGRTFGPSYSIFVQLQNTTTTMGATSSCPGSHLCAVGPMDEFCDANGFQLVNADGIWRAGDALLMNMNSWHRGAAHTGKDEDARVMLILTFVPRPRRVAETRQMSQGITFSLRWDMWGHTLDDLADAQTRMRQPWATLRALGLYKPSNTDWGVDYISGAAMRIASGDNGFQQEDLENFVQRGGIPLLPSFVQSNMTEDGWHGYLTETISNCQEFTKMGLMAGVASFFVVQILFLIVGILFTPRGENKNNKDGPFKRFSWAVTRFILINGFVYFLYKQVRGRLDNSQWAQDIRGNRLYVPNFESEDDEYRGLTTFPYKRDILIEQRYGSAYLNMYNDFIGIHPGNSEFTQHIDSHAALWHNYSGLPDCFQDALVTDILASMEYQQRRFLYQSPGSHWVVMSRPDKRRYVYDEIRGRSNEILRQVLIQLRYLNSEAKYGRNRGTGMTLLDTLPFLDDLKRKFLILQDPPDEEKRKRRRLLMARPSASGPPKPNDQQGLFLSLSSLTTKPPRTMSPDKPRVPTLKMKIRPREPVEGAWIKQGDIVEGKYYNDNGAYWYYAKVDHMASMGYFSVSYYDGEKDHLTPETIRRYQPLSKNEQIEVFIENQDYIPAIVIGKTKKDHYTVQFPHSGQVMQGVFKGFFRRISMDEDYGSDEGDEDDYED